MTKLRHENPRSKVRERLDSKSLIVTIPEKIVFAYRLKAGDKIEWTIVKDGYAEYVKISKTQE
jgi:bifunctional DNA-binding transcriptional regulator/antitoxin component of YhaV-PrlF toxin-antitoxin module